MKINENVIDFCLRNSMMLHSLIIQIVCYFLYLARSYKPMTFTKTCIFLKKTMNPLTIKHFLLLSLLAAPWAAQAHTPYVLPNNFAVSARSAVISVDASLTEDFFVPDVSYGQHPFTLTAPDGSLIPIPDSAIHPLAVRTVVEHKLSDAAQGTYRITAGPRIGAITRSWEIEGEVKRIRDPEVPIPAGAVLKSHSQSISVSESYISIGTINPDQTFGATGKGLEVVPVTHPGQLVAGNAFDFVIHHDGQPLANHKVDITYASIAGNNSKYTLETDNTGKAHYVLQQPGIYLASVRYSTGGPVSAEKPTLNYSYTLTFHVNAANSD